MALSPDQYNRYAEIIKDFLAQQDDISKIAYLKESPSMDGNTKGRPWSCLVCARNSLTALKPNVPAEKLEVLTAIDEGITALNSILQIKYTAQVATYLYRNEESFTKKISTLVDKLGTLDKNLHAEVIKSIYYLMLSLENNKRGSPAVTAIKEKCRAIFIGKLEGQGMHDPVLYLLGISNKLQIAQQEISQKIKDCEDEDTYLKELAIVATRISELNSSGNFEKFFEYYDNEEKLKQLANTLKLPISEQERWLDSFRTHFLSKWHPYRWLNPPITVASLTKQVASSIDQSFAKAFYLEKLAHWDSLQKKLVCYVGDSKKLFEDYLTEVDAALLFDTVTTPENTTYWEDKCLSHDEHPLTDEDIVAFKKISSQMVKDLLSKLKSNSFEIPKDLNFTIQQKVKFCSTQNLQLKQSLQQASDSITLLLNDKTEKALQEFAGFPNVFAWIFSPAYVECYNSIRKLVKEHSHNNKEKWLDRNISAQVKEIIQKANNKADKEEHLILEPKKRFAELAKFFDPLPKPDEKHAAPASYSLNADVADSHLDSKGPSPTTFH